MSLSLKSRYKGLEFIVVLMVLGFTFWSLFYGRKPYGLDGLGFDGVRYASMARDFYAHLTHSASHYQNGYYVHRIFSSMVVYLLSQVFHIDLIKNHSIMRLFCVVDFSCIIAAMFVYYKIAKHYSFNLWVRIFGFSAFFINYPVLNMLGYYPVLTDIPAMFFGLLIFYSYTSRGLFVFSLTALVGSFVFPPLLSISLVLLLFYGQKFKKHEEGINQKIIFCNFSKHQLVTTVKLSKKNLLLILWLFVGGLILWSILLRSSGSHASVNANLYPGILFQLISYPFVCAYLFLGLRPLILKFARMKITLPYKNIIACLSVYVLSFLIGLWLQGGRHLHDGHTLLWFLKVVLLEGTSFPLINILGNFVYYGPIMIVMIYFWGDFVAVCRELGMGVFFVICFVFILTLGSESRQLIFATSFFFIPLLIVLNQRKLRIGQLIFFTVTSVMLSKFWLYIPTLKLADPSKYWQFPDQYYFLSQGCYMSSFTYLLQGAFFVAILFSYQCYFKINK